MVFTPDPDYSDCPSLHAEANALMSTDRTEREGGIIYVTSHVCFGCAKLIANSGLAKVVVETDKADAHRNPLASYQFLLDCGIQVELSDQVMMSRLHKRGLDDAPPQEWYLVKGGGITSIVPGPPLGGPFPPRSTADTLVTKYEGGSMVDTMVMLANQELERKSPWRDA